MRTYIDSSVLVAVYVPERFSRAARAYVRSAGQVLFTALHRLEVPNAFELLVRRGAITRDERAMERQLREDLEAQRLAPVSIDFDRVFADRTVANAHSEAFFPQPGFTSRRGGTCVGVHGLRLSRRPAVGGGEGPPG